MKSPHLLIQRQLMPAKLELSSYARFAPLSGWHIVLIAQRPSVWQPSRSSVDEELKQQRQQQQLLLEYNVILSGAWYWQPGLLRRVQSAYDSLANYVERYPQHEVVLVCTRKELLRAGQRLGLKMISVGEKSLNTVTNVDNLQQAISLLPDLIEHS